MAVVRASASGENKASETLTNLVALEAPKEFCGSRWFTGNYNGMLVLVSMACIVDSDGEINGIERPGYTNKKGYWVEPYIAAADSPAVPVFLTVVKDKAGKLWDLSTRHSVNLREHEAESEKTAKSRKPMPTFGK